MNSCQFLLQWVHTSSSESRPIMHSVWSLSLLYLVGVRPVLVLGPVRGVGEGLVAAFVLADVGFLPGVRAQVGLQVLQAGVGLGAALELQRRSLERKFMTGKSFACLIVVDFLCFPLETTSSWDNQRKHQTAHQFVHQHAPFLSDNYLLNYLDYFPAELLNILFSRISEGDSAFIYLVRILNNHSGAQIRLCS